jgi:hypothetical protein
MAPQRKRPVQRAFSGLVGLPPEPDAALAPIAPKLGKFLDPSNTTQGMLEEYKHAEISKRALAARARRKLQSDQIKNLKKALRTPVAQIKAEPAEKLKTEKLPLMSTGSYVRDAPAGLGLFVTGGYDAAEIDYITGLEVAEEATLGSGKNTSDELIGGRRRVQPEGNSADDGSLNGNRIFQVKLNETDPSQLENALAHLVGEYFAPLELVQCECGAVLDTDGLDSHSEVHEGRFRYHNTASCRLCRSIVSSQEAADAHIASVHGEEEEPAHDARFGNVIQKYLRKRAREKRKIERLGKKKLAEILPLRPSTASPLRAQSEGWKQEGKWVHVPGRGWVQEWVRESVTA